MEYVSVKSLTKLYIYYSANGIGKQSQSTHFDKKNRT